MSTIISLDDKIREFAGQSLRDIDLVLDSSTGQSHFPFVERDFSLIQDLKSKSVLSNSYGSYISRVFISSLNEEKKFPVLDQDNKQLYFPNKRNFDVYVGELERLFPKGSEFYRAFKGN